MKRVVLSAAVLLVTIVECIDAQGASSAAPVTVNAAAPVDSRGIGFRW